jgi:flagellar motor switch protein FliM
LPKQTALDQAAARARMRLDAMLGSVEVELPKLLDLRCGDVLRLPLRLDQRICVLCEGIPLAHAALGETQGRKGMQVIARHP